MKADRVRHDDRSGQTPGGNIAALRSGAVTQPAPVHAGCTRCSDADTVLLSQLLQEWHEFYESGHQKLGHC